MHDAGAALAFLDFKTEAVFRAELLRGDFVDGLIDVGEDSQFHQVGDQLEWLFLELFRQVADDDRRFERDHFAGGGRDKFGPCRDSRGRGGFGGWFLRRWEKGRTLAWPQRPGNLGRFGR